MRLSAPSSTVRSRCDVQHTLQALRQACSPFVLVYIFGACAVLVGSISSASWLCAVVTARRPPPAGAVTQKHINEGALNAYAIGEGFEGSASDWTEYVVWTVGVAALIFYLSGVVKIDVYNIDEEPAAAQRSAAFSQRRFELATIARPPPLC